MSARRLVLLAAALGLVLGVGLTWPLVTHLGSQVLDDGSLDGFQFAWNVWWVRESLLHLHRLPFWTDYLFYPDGVPLLFHTGSFALGLVSLPVQLVAGPIVAHNLLVITAPALTAVAVALLAYEIVGDAWAALVAGLLGAVTPFTVWTLPVIYLSSAWVPPALLALWWVLQRRRRAWLVVAAVLLLWFCVFVSQEYAMLAVALLGLDVVLRLVLAERLGFPRLWLAGTLAFFAVAGVSLGALAAVALANPAQLPPPDGTLLASGFILAFLSPPWLVHWALPSARVFYVGTLPVVCAVLALCLAPRRAAYAALVALPLLGMALGPRMYLRHPLLALVDPGAGGPGFELPGPYAVANKLFPLLKFLRAPYRWMAGGDAMVAVLAGVGVAALRARMARPAPRAAVTAAALLLAVVVPAVESGDLRHGGSSTAVPAAYDVVSRDPTAAALLDVPSGFSTRGFALFSSRYMFYQTAHRKFLLDGTVSRLPPDRLPVYQRQFDDFAKLPWLAWVVVHRDLLAEASDPGRAQAAAVAALAARQGRLVASDATTDVYRLDTFRPETVRAAGRDAASAPDLRLGPPARVG